MFNSINKSAYHDQLQDIILPQVAPQHPASLVTCLKHIKFTLIFNTPFFSWDLNCDCRCALPGYSYPAVQMFLFVHYL